MCDCLYAILVFAFSMAYSLTLKNTLLISYVKFPEQNFHDHVIMPIDIKLVIPRDLVSIYW